MKLIPMRVTMYYEMESNIDSRYAVKNIKPSQAASEERLRKSEREKRPPTRPKR